MKDTKTAQTETAQAGSVQRIVSMTLETAKQIYIEAGGNKTHSESEWNDVHKEMEAIVAASSERSASKVIDWWGCWDRKYTATAFAKRVRASHANSIYWPRLAGRSSTGGFGSRQGFYAADSGLPSLIVNLLRQPRARDRSGWEAVYRLPVLRAKPNWVCLCKP